MNSVSMSDLELTSVLLQARAPGTRSRGGVHRKYRQRGKYYEIVLCTKIRTGDGAPLPRSGQAMAES